MLGFALPNFRIFTFPFLSAEGREARALSRLQLRETFLLVAFASFLRKKSPSPLGRALGDARSTRAARGRPHSPRASAASPHRRARLLNSLFPTFPPKSAPFRAQPRPGQGLCGAAAARSPQAGAGAAPAAAAFPAGERAPALLRRLFVFGRAPPLLSPRKIMKYGTRFALFV